MAVDKALSSHLWHKKLEGLLGVWHKMCLAPSGTHKARTQSLFSAGLVLWAIRLHQLHVPTKRLQWADHWASHQSRKFLQAHSLPAVPSHCQSHQTTASESQSSCMESPWRRGGHPLCHTPEPPSTGAHTAVLQGKGNLHHSEFWKFPSTLQWGGGAESVWQNKIWAPEGLWVSLNACFRHICSVSCICGILQCHPRDPFQCRECQISPLCHSSLRG